MKILSIETSCDETAAAIVEWNPPSSDSGEASGGQAVVRANTVSSQASLHAKWGGVVPDLASREHIKNIIPVIEETLASAGMIPADIDLIAVTQGPGLMPALLIGVSAAKTLALVWQKPLIGIQHLEGHIYANFLNSRNFQFPISNFPAKAKPRQGGGQKNPNDQILKAKSQKPKAIFPLIALVVSGGHTELVLMQKHFDYTILGETQDDAAGEAFDKVAKLLGLTYPGGPAVAQKADAFRARNFQFLNSNFPAGAEPRQGGGQINHNNQIPKNRQGLFPRPMLDSDNFDFSFSGLKTAVLYFLRKHETKKNDEQFIDMVCHEFQEAVVDVLVGKTEKALRLYAPETFVIAGGVSANVRLRERLQKTIDTLNLEVRLPNEDGIAFLTPEFAYSLDNAAMIGIAAALRYEHMSEEQKTILMRTPLTLDPDANMPLQNL